MPDSLHGQGVSLDAASNLTDECLSCDRCTPAYNYSSEQRCPESKRDCGHHCNHSWTHDRCDWCGEEWGES